MRWGQEGARHSKRHLLVDTEGLLLESQGAQRQGPPTPGWLEAATGLSPHSAVSELKHLWLDAGYEGRGKRWVEEVFNLSVEIVRRPAKPVPEEVARSWAQEWAKEGKEVNWQRLMPPRGFSWYYRGVGLWNAPSLLTLSKQEDEQGLREAHCQR
jgi:hypothetical protein